MDAMVALMEAQAMKQKARKPLTVTFPNWRKLHWSRQVELARAIGGNVNSAEEATKYLEALEDEQNR